MNPFSQTRIERVIAGKKETRVDWIKPKAAGLQAHEHPLEKDELRYRADSKFSSRQVEGPE